MIRKGAYAILIAIVTGLIPVVGSVYTDVITLKSTIPKIEEKQKETLNNINRKLEIIDDRLYEIHTKLIK